VLSQVFPARPSSIPDIRDFVRRCLAESPLNEEGTREVGETVFRALLDAAGPTGSIQVAFRIFPEHVEVDVLHSDTQLHQLPGGPVVPVANGMPPPRPAEPGAGPGPRPADTVAARADGSRPGSPAGAGPHQSGPHRPHQAGPQPAGPGQAAGDDPPATFAEWMASALRREGLTQEAAAQQLGVSVKTVSRWVGGATEPRMRDLRRIQEIFGEVPLP
jgi:DNA-binding XRE family transcriptional regulator